MLNVGLHFKPYFLAHSVLMSTGCFLGTCNMGMEDYNFSKEGEAS